MHDRSDIVISNEWLVVGAKAAKTHNQPSGLNKANTKRYSRTQNNKTRKRHKAA